jgi:glycosyltransferase involved in cell wall biosynthesis
MRLAFVAMETVHHAESAGRRRLHRVASHLADAGHQVTIYCAQWWDGTGVRHQLDGVTFHAVTTDPRPRAFALRVPYLLARNRPDVVHVAATPPLVVHAADLGRRLARAPLILDWYGDEGVPESWLATQAVQIADVVVSPSEMVRTRVRERAAGDNTTDVIPKSIDMDLVRETEPGAPTDVVYAHRLDASANLDSLLLGLAELRTKEWQATVIGDGPERAAYEQQASDLRIDDRVTFLGECGRAERVARYKSAHVFVQTALRECFAVELLWALACGCVGIVEYQTDSSAHELIERRERSYRVTNTQQMADAIAESGSFERRQVDANLREYDHDAVRETYETMYADAIGNFGLLG